MNTLTTHETAERIAEQLSRPPASEEAGQCQSLSRGSAGIALLHVERARAGTGSWARAHAWVRAATAHTVLAGADTSLYLGAPAISMLLLTAADCIPTYSMTVNTLCDAVIKTVHRRVDAALDRIHHGLPAEFAEYDLFRGLTGLGRLLLAHTPGNDAMARILHYLIRLTQPLHSVGTTRPGWWVSHDPDPKMPTPGGHANFGLAHGIAGPLALLAIAMQHGITVPGQAEAIERLCSHYDTCRQDTVAGPWWPQWVTHDQQHTTEHHGPPRPSWCYGTPGIGRAQQLAALALNDTTRQQYVEQAIAACLTDPAQRELITDIGLCHGWAGLYQTIWRIAADARTPVIGSHLPELADRLTQHVKPNQFDYDPGLLTGAAGAGLALHTAAAHAPPLSKWDTCLLII